MRKHLGKILVGTALAITFAIPAAQSLRADDECHRRLEHDRARIDREVARHGERSPEADRARDRMEEDRHWCRDHHIDWDHDRYDGGLYIHVHP